MYYFIDFENVGESGLEGVKNLTSEDKVFVFYGQNAKTIPFERMIEIISSGAGLEFIKSNKIAKNYVDFQLTSYAGYFIGMGYRGTIVIVSKDTGFDSAVDFWKARNMQVIRREQIAAQPKQNNGQQKKQQRNSNSQRSRQNGRNRNGRPADQAAEPQNMPAAAEKAQEMPAAAVTEAETEAEVHTEPAETVQAENLQAEEAAAESPAEEAGIPAETQAENAETSETAGEAQPEETAGETEQTEKKKNRRRRGGRRNSFEDFVKQTIAEKTDAAETGEEKPADRKETAAEAQVTETEAAAETETITEAAESDASETAGEHQETRQQNRPDRQNKPAVPESVRKKIRAAVKDENLPSTKYTAIYRMFDKAQNADQLKNSIEKGFGAEKGGKLAELLTPVFTGYKGEMPGI